MNKLESILKKYHHIGILLLFVITFSSCKREMENEIISITPPELSVIVYNGTNNNDRAAGAVVKLYLSESDRSADKNMISSATTNSAGEAVFTKDNFRKGIMYLTVTKGTSTTLAATPYLLQNDGKTLFWVAL